MTLHFFYPAIFSPQGVTKMNLVKDDGLLPPHHKVRLDIDLVTSLRCGGQWTKVKHISARISLRPEREWKGNVYPHTCKCFLEWNQLFVLCLVVNQPGTMTFFKKNCHIKQMSGAASQGEIGKSIKKGQKNRSNYKFHFNRKVSALTERLEKSRVGSPLWGVFLQRCSPLHLLQVTENLWLMLKLKEAARDCPDSQNVPPSLPPYLTLLLFLSLSVFSPMLSHRWSQNLLQTPHDREIKETLRGQIPRVFLRRQLNTTCRGCFCVLWPAPWTWQCKRCLDKQVCHCHSGESVWLPLAHTNWVSLRDYNAL